MYTIAVQLLLIAGLVLCPFRCQVREAVCTSKGIGESAERQCACQNCRPETGDSGEQSPRPASDDDAPAEGQCQCICAGAVLEKSDLTDLLDALCVVACLHGHHAAPAVEATCLRQFGEPPPCGPGINAGRALCLLHSSLLC